MRRALMRAPARLHAQRWQKFCRVSMFIDVAVVYAITPARALRCRAAAMLAYAPRQYARAAAFCLRAM